MKSDPIEDIYPASPMQTGMLFHSLYDSVPGIYCEQVLLDLPGDLGVTAFERAWQRVIDQHAILRTAFIWEELEEPLQVVCTQAQLPLEQRDWRELPPAKQEQRLLDLLEAERKRGFDFAKAPLMRLILVRTAEDAHKSVLTYHHLLLDGWSLSLLLRQVFAFYEALSGNQDVPPEPQRPYRDYIAWLKQQDLSPVEAYWRRALKGFTAPTPLNFDHTSNGLSRTEQGYAEQGVKLSQTDTAALQTLARQQQLTLNTFVQGAWALLLSRYSGEGDVLFGALVSGRPADLKGVDAMVGLFINSLPVRVQVPPQAALLPWLKDLQSKNFELRQYEHSPLRKIQSWSEIGRGQPLFESILIFENYPLEIESFFGAQNASAWRIKVRSLQLTNYPLHVMIVPGERLLLHVTYDRQRFDAGSITRLLGHFKTLLESMIARPETRLSELSMLTGAERQQLLLDWNTTQADFNYDQCFSQLFEAQVERSPEAIAALCAGEKVTYRELNQRANGLAHYLVARGIGPEEIVAVLAERSIAFLTTVLAILKAGGAYLPLDPRHPPQRLGQVLQQSRPRIVLTSQGFAATLQQAFASASLDRSPPLALIEEALAQNLPVANLPPRSAPEQLAYVIYTSGSTGIPKGAMVEQRGMINHLYAKISDLQLTASDVIAQNAPQCFDISVWQFLAALLVGGTTLVIGDEIAYDPTRLLAEVAQNDVSVLEVVPSLLRAMLELVACPELPALRWLMPTGEALPPASSHQWLTAYPDIPLVNAYGPTECSDDVTHAFITTPPPPGASHVPIGRPIANMRMYVLEAGLAPLPVGLAGELYVGGVGVGRGYLYDAVRTATAFVPDPFGTQAGGRLYRTGDLVRYLSDGNLEFLGRVDYQVKIRGFRIEIGEIETVLGRHVAVREAVVLAREDTPGDKRLVAYVVSEPGFTPAANELRHFLGQRLPDYMVPAAFVTLESLPLTPNGKVNRRALPAPQYDRSHLTVAFAPPRNPTEKALAGIWCEVLKLDRAGIHDNFFELGGDSILSIQIITRANQIGLRLSPQQIFEHQTIAELAAAVEPSRAVQAEQGPVSGPVPLTPIQRHFFAHQLPNPHHWNMALLLKIRRPLDPALLEQALNALLGHHDVLRLRFQPTASGWEQHNAAETSPLVCEQVDLSGLPASEQAAALTHTAAQAQASLDLGAGPLLRALLFDLGPQQGERLLLAIHHLAVDGVSWRILLEDLELAYYQLERGQEVILPAKTTSFRYWAEALARYAQSGGLEQELNYWLQMTPGAVAPLPRDFAEGANEARLVASVTTTLSAEETKALLQEVPRAYQTQINDALLTALAQALSQWTASRTLLVDVEGHGRANLFPEVDLSRTVGWFTALYPVLLQLPEGEGAGQALQAVKEQLRQIPQQGIGYGLLHYLREDGVQATPQAEFPAAEVSFNYMGQVDRWQTEDALFDLAWEETGPLHDPQGRRWHVLEVNGWVYSGQLQVQWRFSTQIHRRETVQELAQAFTSALRNLVQHCLSLETTPPPTSQDTVTHPKDAWEVLEL